MLYKYYPFFFKRKNKICRLINFLNNFSANAHVKAALLTTSLHFANCNSAHLVLTNKFYFESLCNACNYNY